ncbi:MAG: cyanophycin synthetase family protein, partial [Fimbriiglobus sp.]
MSGLKILRVSALRGPNIWARFPVLEVWVDLETLADTSSDELPGFNDRLKAMLPSLIEHRCSVGERGGFFQRLARGTYLAHIFEHVVLELQSLAGTEVGYGKTRETHSQPGVYKIGIEYDDEDLARAACELGRTVCLAAVTGDPIDLPAGLAELRAIRDRNRPSAVLADLLAEAKAAGVPARVLDASGLVQLGHASRQRRVLVSQGLTDGSSGVGVGIAGDRTLTRTVLKAAGIPVMPGVAPKTADGAVEAAEELGYPVVLRPRTPDTNVAPVGPLADAAAVRAAAAALDGAWPFVVEPAPAGAEYQLLVVGGKLVSALDAAGADATDRIHPAVAERAADAAHALKLDVAAVEIVTPDPTHPLEAVAGVVVGVRPQPDLEAFSRPTAGRPRPVMKPVLDSLFPDPKKSRIPIVAVTGTNGKTTTARLAAHLLGQVWGPVGMTCTDGIHIDGRRIETGDCSGPKSARMVLQHPAPNAAVLETARGGILREGLGFDKCDVAIVTNIAHGDHLGTSDIMTAADLAGVKETIVWAVAPTGAAVLNATDPLVVNMKRLCDGATIFFAMKETDPVLAAHRAAGGKVAFARENVVVLADGPRETLLIDLDRVPLTHGGLVGFQVENVLAAAAAAWFLGVPLDAIRRGLETFSSSLELVPARFNLLEIRGATVVGDYGHNTSALERLLEVFGGLPHRYRTVVYSAAGDRRDSDILEQAEMLGNFFDRVFLYEDTCRRGRPIGEITALFRQGLAKGSRVKDVREVAGGLPSIHAAIAAAIPGELILIQLDLVDDSMALFKRVIEAGGREVTLGEAVAAIRAAAGVTVRDSRVGTTAVAARNFVAGEVVARGWGPTRTAPAEGTFQVDHDRFLDPPAPLRHLTHSCEPNCGLLVRVGVDHVEAHAFRDIAAGEELTLDHDTFTAVVRPTGQECECRAPGC